MKPLLVITFEEMETAINTFIIPNEQGTYYFYDYSLMVMCCNQYKSDENVVTVYENHNGWSEVGEFEYSIIDDKGKIDIELDVIDGALCLYNGKNAIAHNDCLPIILGDNYDESYIGFDDMELWLKKVDATIKSFYGYRIPIIFSRIPFVINAIVGYDPPKEAGIKFNPGDTFSDVANMIIDKNLSSIEKDIEDWERLCNDCERSYERHM